MGAWLLKNWLPLSGASLLTLAVCYGLHTISVGMIEAKHEKALTEQKTVLTAQCEAAKAITEEVSYDYQKELAVRDTSLADARRLLNNKCTASVVGIASTGHHGSSGSDKPSGSNDSGIRADANELIDIAAEGEKYRLQLIGCQAFVNRSRAARMNQ